MPTTATTTIEPSPLDHPPADLAGRPFFEHALALLRGVRDHDLASLSALCDDDHGIVDVDPAGRSVPIRTRAGWEAWFRDLFATLDAMGAATDSEVLAYDAVQGEDLGWSALEFRQLLAVGQHVATFDCVATIVWKRTPQGWREARWHASVVSSEVPEALRAAA